MKQQCGVFYGDDKTIRQYLESLVCTHRTPQRCGGCHKCSNTLRETGLFHYMHTPNYYRYIKQYRV